MAKILAMGAYLYQAALAFGLLLVVARLLAPSDYASYSLFISISQFGANALFEWIRFACSRFYPGLTAESEAVQRRAMALEFSFCMLICLSIALAAAAFGIPLWIALIGGAVAIFQGGSDLLLTMLRFRQQFRAFSWLQGLRATFLAIGTLSGTAIQASFGYAISGLLAGYVVHMAVAFLATRHERGRPARWDIEVIRTHLAYGSVSAGASAIGLLAPLGLKSILTATMGPQNAAGAMLALDLLQRPFIMIVAALQAIQYPDLVTLFDRDGVNAVFSRRLGQYYALLTSFSLIMAAGIIALLRPVAILLVAPELQNAFLQTAPYIVIVALVRTLTQSMTPTSAHLRRHLPSIFILAAIDCAFLNIFALAAFHIFGAADGSIMAGATLGALIAGLLGGKVLVSLPFDYIWRPVALALAGLAITALATAMPIGSLVLATGIGVAGSGLFSALALYEMLRGKRLQPLDTVPADAG